MSTRPPSPPSRWRSNAAGLAVLALLLQLLFGQAAMLRMAADGDGMRCAAHPAGGTADRQGAPQPLAHHETCPLCAGFAAMTGPVASATAPADIEPANPLAPPVSRAAPGRPAPAYSPRAPPLA